MMTTVTEDNFSREVLSSTVPSLIHFKAPWCGICRLVTPILNSFQAECTAPLRFIEINADENFKLTNQYQLKTLPTLLYFENGRVLHRIEGFKSHESLREQLKSILLRQQIESAFSGFTPITKSSS